MRVAVVGLGKLGAPLAAVLASKGHDVLGIDVSDRVVELVNEGVAPVDEPELQDLVSANRERLRATTDLAAAADADVSVVLVPTPSDDSGAFSNAHVLAATDRIGKALARHSAYHLVVVASTVMPGTCQAEVLPLLEEASGRRVGETLGLCYSPEFIALGSVIRDMTTPDMVLIGESDPRAGEALERLYRTVCENDPPFRRMNLVNAELTKIAVNTYVTMKISYANVLAEICERLPEAHADTITDALGLDSRIGSKYLRGAIAYGGPCFPRDNKAFSTFARRLDVDPLLAEATDSVNRRQVDRLARVVRSHLGEHDAVGILGLAYKAGTGVAEESAGVALARLLAESGYDVHVFDPLATSAAIATLDGLVHTCGSAEELLERCDVAVIATPWPQFAELPIERAERPGRRRVVVDCWGVLSDEMYGEAMNIVRLGHGPDTASALELVGGSDHGERRLTY